jgi:hypothetical protein
MTDEVSRPVMVDRVRGLIIVQQSSYSLSEFRAAYMQRGPNGRYLAVLDLGPDDHVVIYKGTKQKDARTAIDHFTDQLVPKSKQLPQKLRVAA